MRTYFFRVEVSRDEKLYVAQAFDKRGAFLGVVSEETREDALVEVKALALEALLQIASEGKDPLEGLYQNPPKTGGVQATLQDVFPIVLRFKRCKHGLSQTRLAESMNVRQQAYSKLERPGKSNPTLATIEQLSLILKEDILALA